MHSLATISIIQDLRPIEGKDRIELARVENYNSIVQKGQFSIGEKVIYIYYDSILPEKPEFEFLRKRCWSEKYKGFRIRPMKMGGEVSEGLVMPLSILPGGDKLPVGTVVEDRLAIRRYDPEAAAPTIPQKKRWWMRYPLVRSILRAFGIGKPKKAKGYPAKLPKADEENIEKIWEEIRWSKDEFIITEKMEGSAAMYVLDRKGKIHIFSHNWEVGVDGCWGRVAIIYDLEKVLRRLGKTKKRRIAIQGEICGPKIQKNIYGFEDYRFFLYGAYDADSGEKLGYSELEDLARFSSLEMVPFIRRGRVLESVDAMLADCDGESTFGSCPREGLVWRTEDGRTHFKCKSRPYKVWFAE